MEAEAWSSCICSPVQWQTRCSSVESAHRVSADGILPGRWSPFGYRFPWTPPDKPHRQVSPTLYNRTEGCRVEAVD